MKQASTHILRGAVLLIGLIILVLCVFVLPRGIVSDTTGDYRPVLIGMYVTAIPFFAALFHTIKLLGYIDAGKIFSAASVKALKHIKYCAFAISAMYGAGLPYIYYVADKDDAPGVVALGCVLVGVSFVVGSATTVLQSLVQQALAIKSENDLTV